MKTLVVVPARGGSRGLPGKNLRTVDGLSLLARAVMCGRLFLDRLGRPDDGILVDTDAEDIAEEGRSWGAAVPFLRPSQLALDTTSSYESVEHALRRWETERGPVEALVLLQPTSPLRLPEDVARCCERFGPRTPSVITVTRTTPPPEFALRMDSQGQLAWAFGRPDATRRQDLPPAWHPNGAVYVQTPAFLREHRTFVAPGVTRGVEMPAERSVDVDAALDLVVAEEVLRAGQPARPTVLRIVEGRQDPEWDRFGSSGVSGIYLTESAVSAWGEALPGLFAAAASRGMSAVAERVPSTPDAAIAPFTPAFRVSDPGLGDWLLDASRKAWVRYDAGAGRQELLALARRASVEQVTLLGEDPGGCAEGLGLARLAGWRTALGAPSRPDLRPPQGVDFELAQAARP